MVEQYAEASDDRTLELARDLAGTMRVVADDERLWDDLAAGSERGGDHGPVWALALLDWETLLREWEVPDAEETALELIDAVGRGANEPGAWEQVRGLLRELAERIDGETPAPPEDRRWWRAAKERMADGVSVLRRVKIGALVARATKGGVDAAAPTLLGGLMGVPLGPVGIIAGVAICNIGWVAVGEVRAAIERPSKEERSRLAGLFASPELNPAAGGRARGSLNSIEDLLAATSDGPIPKVEIAEMLANLRRWVACVGARILSARPLIAARLGAAGLSEVESILEAAVELQRDLHKTGEAVRDEVTGLVRMGLGHAGRALDRLRDRLHSLERELVKAGFGGHPL